MVTSMGMPGMAGLGMFGMGGMGAGGQVPPPWASMPPQGAPPTNSPWARMLGMPQGAGGVDPTNAMGQLGQGTPQAPTGAWATNPSSAPPWFQAAMQSPGGVQGYLQNMQAQQLAAKQAGQGAGSPNPQQLAAWQAMQAGQGQMPQGPGILSGMGGQMPWGPQQPPRGMPRQPMPQYRPPARPRQAVYGGGGAGNISLSGY